MKSAPKNNSPLQTLGVALRVALVTLTLTGFLYPFAVTALAQLFFPNEANGSLLQTAEGSLLGSRLIGQGFAHPAYVHPRPSAAGAGYDAMASGGSNLGPSSAKLRDRVLAHLKQMPSHYPSPLPIPVELVTASGSGLDPHLSPAGVRWQLTRIAQARGVDPARIARAMDEMTMHREFGFLGESTVNVLELNLALDRQFGKPHGHRAKIDLPQ